MALSSSPRAAGRFVLLPKDLVTDRRKPCNLNFARPASSDGRAGFARVLGSPSHVNCWGRSHLDDGALCPAREAGECADSCSAKHGFRGRYYSEPAHLVGHRTRICDFGVVGIDGFWRPLHGKPNPSVGRSAAVAERLLGKSSASL